jgi:2-polyprenyl-3-methyl-5-hydroxy-6-metoxy-1,4-benzoquinol methylase
MRNNNSQNGQTFSTTAEAEYADRLRLIQRVWWKRLLPVQAPYQWNIRRQKLGRTIEVGCGIGRNMRSLARGSVGIDHNLAAVRIAKAQGFRAMTPEEWDVSDERKAGMFDGLLVSHVLEHMDPQAAQALLRAYLPSVRQGGRVFLICPQERGYRSDPTHEHFFDGEQLERLAEDAGLAADRWFSFPFPRSAGPLFIYNEFCLLATKA